LPSALVVQMSSWLSNTIRPESEDRSSPLRLGDSAAAADGGPAAALDRPHRCTPQYERRRQRHREDVTLPHPPRIHPGLPRGSNGSINDEIAGLVVATEARRRSAKHASIMGPAPDRSYQARQRSRSNRREDSRESNPPGSSRPHRFVRSWWSDGSDGSRPHRSPTWASGQTWTTSGMSTRA
jgi:hypothetical protein